MSNLPHCKLLFRFALKLLPHYLRSRSLNQTRWVCNVNFKGFFLVDDNIDSEKHTKRFGDVTRTIFLCKSSRLVWHSSNAFSPVPSSSLDRPTCIGSIHGAGAAIGSGFQRLHIKPPPSRCWSIGWQSWYSAREGPVAVTEAHRVPRADAAESFGQAHWMLQAQERENTRGISTDNCEYA